MDEEQKRSKEKKQADLSSLSPIPEAQESNNIGTAEDILSERLRNLTEAIEEIDRALEERQILSEQFKKQINGEVKEVKYHLDLLQPPWKVGYEPTYEFLRLSLHKSLASRSKDKRSEELKFWQDVAGLVQQRRKLVDEYKALLSTRKRLEGEE